MRKALLILSLTLALSGCFDEEEKNDIEPETMADCIAIQNPNDRDICEMKLNEKMKEKRMESLGDKEFKNIDW